MKRIRFTEEQIIEVLRERRSPGFRGSREPVRRPPTGLVTPGIGRSRCPSLCKRRRTLDQLGESQWRGIGK